MFGSSVLESESFSHGTMAQPFMRYDEYAASAGVEREASCGIFARAITEYQRREGTLESQSLADRTGAVEFWRAQMF